MEKSLTCPDCGAALPSKGAKCPYKTERKSRSIKKVQNPNSKFFLICSLSAIFSLVLALVMIVLDSYDMAISFRILAIIISVAGFAVMLSKNEYRRAFFLLIPSIFLFSGLIQ